MRKGVRLCITGSEVMNGFVLDRNTQFFASELYARGLELVESRIMPDDPQQIVKTWKEFSATGDLIVNSGGLGPTSDDLTVDLLCDWLGDTPVYEPHAEKRTRYFFEKRARDKTRVMSIDVALRQARIPSRATAIKNTVGLAPGIFIPEIPFIALPGFPDEIKGMWAEVLAIIEQLDFNRSAMRIVPLWGVGESQLFSELEKPEGVLVGVHALPWGCRLFLRADPKHEPALDGNGGNSADAVSRTDR
jgi:nicotinamide-nucleotide amidase